MSSQPAKIGVLHTNLGGLNKRALKYLILHQNTIQKSFEFQFLPTPSNTEFLHLLDSDEPINRQKAMGLANNFFEDYDSWLNKSAMEYGLTHSQLDGYVVLSTAKFSDNYYLDGDVNWMVIALGHWEKSMGPPSIIEFFLTLLAESAIGMACKKNWPSSHHATMGCAFDFTASLEDARWSVLNGFLCASCREAIGKNGQDKLLDDSLLLLKRDWLGVPEAPSIIATTTKKLGYDLFHTRGVKPTLWERLATTIEEEAVKNIFKIIVAVVIAGLLLWLGLKK